MNPVLRLAVCLSVLGVATSCHSNSSGRSFGVPERLENQVGSAGFADVGLSETGEATIVWSATDENNPLDRLIYASHGSASGGWSSPSIIDNRLGDPFSPRIAMSPNGAVTAVWEQVEFVNPEHHAYANTYDPQAGWGTPIRLSSSEHQERPRVSTNAAGAVSVVWRDFGSLGGRFVFSRDFTEQSGWSAALPVDEDKDSAGFPRVSVDSTGRAIVAWKASEGIGSNQIFSNRQLDDGTWGLTEELSSTPGVSSPELAADTFGNALVVWAQSELGRNTLVASSYVPTSGWTVPVEIAALEGASQRPAISFDADGNAVVVWEQRNPSTVDIYSARRSTSGDWGAPVLIDALDGFAEFPDIDTDSAGNAIVTWRQFDGEAKSIFAARYRANGGWGQPELLESNNSVSSLGDSVGVPQISMNGDGDAIIVWPQFDGQNFSVFRIWFR